MTTKYIRDERAQRRYRTNNVNNNRQHPDKRAINQSPEQIASDLVQQFNFYCTSLHAKSTFDFDQDENNNHRCKLKLSVFPHLQSTGSGASTKKEAKVNSIIAFLAHLEKRKEVGLFVPYVIPSLLRNIQVELRRAVVSVPDLNANVNEYLIADRIVPKRIAEKIDNLLQIIRRIHDVRIVTLCQSSNMTFIYIVGAKNKQDAIQPYVKALFEPDNEQMFNYGEKLFDIFSDEKFLDNVCQRLKVLCDNHLEKCKLFIRGSSVNVQCCYNEFVILRREFENEYHRQRKNPCPVTTVSLLNKELQNTVKHLESTRIDSKEKVPPTEENDDNDDQLPDYSMYDDGVNASMLKVLKNEEGSEEQASNQDETIKPTHTSPEVIEVSDDSSESTELQVVQTTEPKNEKKTDQLQPLMQVQPVLQPYKPQAQPVVVQIQSAPQGPPLLLPLPLTTTTTAKTTSTAPQSKVLRHIVLDGQNIARNSNDYQRTFSWSRLSNAINYFKNRGHDNIIAFLPLYFRDQDNKNLSVVEATRERHFRDTLINSRYIAFTPSRYNNGQRLTNYDDRFILQYAADNDGIVVSNDNFRDLQHEKSFQFIIKNRILPFATINDTFMPATDPLGRNGPHLNDFLVKGYL